MIGNMRASGKAEKRNLENNIAEYHILQGKYLLLM